MSDKFTKRVEIGFGVILAISIFSFIVYFLYSMGALVKFGLIMLGILALFGLCYLVGWAFEWAENKFTEPSGPSKRMNRS